MDVRMWTDGSYTSGSVKGKVEEKIKELIEELAESGWFGAPRDLDCPVEIWDSWEEEFYRVCKGEGGKWYSSFLEV